MLYYDMMNRFLSKRSTYRFTVKALLFHIADIIYVPWSKRPRSKNEARLQHQAEIYRSPIQSLAINTS